MLDVLEDWLEEAQSSLEELGSPFQDLAGLLEQARIQGNIEALEAMIGHVDA